jgi:transcriptional regulator with XRE-family HTH domain
MATVIIGGTGQELGAQRRLLDLSLRQVAAQLMISPTQLQRWERDGRQVEQERLQRWGDALSLAAAARMAGVRRATLGRRSARQRKAEA